MQHAVKATAPILVVLTAVVLAVQLVGTPTDQTDAFPWTAGALLIAIGVVAHLRRWQDHALAALGGTRRHRRDVRHQQ